MYIKPEKKITIRNAVLLGGLCTVAYLAVYVARNLLGAVTPSMVDGGVFSVEQIGTMSSAFFITYAVGQLINGWLGDHISAKYMITLGLVLAGVCHFVFPLFSGSYTACLIAYGLVGIFLSMIYAPMTKVVADSMPLIYATRTSLGYTFSSFLGSPVAGLMAAWMTWQSVFYAGSGILIVMGAVVFLCFTLMEKKAIIHYTKREEKTKQKGGVKVLLKHQIVKFTLVSILTGIVRTTVVFWLPTYLSQRLSFSPENAALIYTVATFIIAFSTFVGIFLYEMLKRNMDLTLLISFSVSAAAFLGAFFVKAPMVNIVFVVLAILASNSATTMLWSVYCPRLKETGMVSSATGFLDFASYMAASASSSIFANSVSVIGWGGLVLTWVGLMVIGVLISLPWRRKRTDPAASE